MPAVVMADQLSDSGPAPLSAPTLVAMGERISPDVIERIVRSTVEVNGLEREVLSGKEVWAPSIGAGFLLTVGGQQLIITNAHVVKDGKVVDVTLAEGSSVPVDLVGYDVLSDLAVLRFRGGNPGVPSAPVGDSNALRLGDPVFTVGHPGGLRNSVSLGIISGLGRNAPGKNILDLIQTDAAINPGNSGGPLVNERGEIVGISSMTWDGGDNLGFAIPITHALPIIKQIAGKGYATHAYLGANVSELTHFALSELNRNGLLPGWASEMRPQKGAVVVNVVPNSPASMAGLQSGDIIKRVDGVEIGGDSAFRTMIAGSNPGSTVTLEVLRREQRMNIKVTLKERRSGGGPFLATMPTR
jgi:S1-C subfamily serine protease